MYYNYNNNLWSIRIKISSGEGTLSWRVPPGKVGGVIAYPLNLTTEHNCI